MQTYTTVIKGLLLLLQKFCTVVVIRSATFIARDLQPYTDITVTESQQTAVTQKVRCDEWEYRCDEWYLRRSAAEPTQVWQLRTQVWRVIPVPVSSRAYTGVTIENTGVTSDTCASQQQSLVVCVDELAVCDARVPQISSGKRTQPAALLPVPHAAHMRMRWESFILPTLHHCRAGTDSENSHNMSEGSYSFGC